MRDGQVVRNAMSAWRRVQLCQGAVAIAFIGCAFYLASVVLTPVRIIGITQLPPGIKYVQHDSRF